MTQPDLARLEGLVAKASGKYDDHSDWLDDVHGYGAADKELANYAAYLPALLARVRELKEAGQFLLWQYDRKGPLAESEEAWEQLRAALTLNRSETDAG